MESEGKVGVREIAIGGGHVQEMDVQWQALTSKLLLVLYIVYVYILHYNKSHSCICVIIIKNQCAKHG